MNDGNRDRIWAAAADLYRRELQREALLSALARNCPVARRRAALQALCELSVETRACLRPTLQRGGSIPADGAKWCERGRRRAGAFSRRRWLVVVEAVLADVAPGVARFEQLERWATASESAALARATALQVAMRSFAELEMRGRSGESLRPARALLDSSKRLAVAAG